MGIACCGNWRIMVLNTFSREVFFKLHTNSVTVLPFITISFTILKLFIKKKKKCSDKPRTLGTDRAV